MQYRFLGLQSFEHVPFQALCFALLQMPGQAFRARAGLETQHRGLDQHALISQFSE